ncbi:MAG: TrpR-related protein YerC/YecD [Clostridiales bacterium]|nr:TrpR-related protein YerC/YecD [Clostridiales bacterium]
MSDYHSKSVERLYEVILKLETKEECRAFFDDICTVRELTDMAKRLETAELLSEGMNYLNIEKKAGVSTATISRVSRCLNYGQGGYTLALKKLKSGEKENDNQ